MRTGRPAIFWLIVMAAAGAAILFVGTPASGAERAQAGGGGRELSTNLYDSCWRLWYTHPADKWENAFPVGNGRLAEATVLSMNGNACRVRLGVPMTVTAEGRAVRCSSPEKGVIEFETERGRSYILSVRRK